MNFLPGPMELILILVIVAMLFGVGKLPEVFGAVGKGIKEFRKETTDPSEKSAATSAEPTPATPATAATPATVGTPAATAAPETTAVDSSAEKVEQA